MEGPLPPLTKIVDDVEGVGVELTRRTWPLVTSGGVHPRPHHCR